MNNGVRHVAHSINLSTIYFLAEVYCAAALCSGNRNTRFCRRRAFTESLLDL